MKKVTIADSMFSPWGKTAWLGGENKDRTPEHFEWEQADPQTARFVSESHVRMAKGPGQVAFMLEGFTLHPENYLAAMEKNFDFVLTHNSYLALNKGWLLFPHGGSWIDFDKWKVYDKKKNVSILLSNKKQLIGHKLFHEVVELYGSKFDGIYGLDQYASKMDALAEYRFSVIVEAEKVDLFFTEKLIDCLSVGTIPIYWGCPSIGDYFDLNGIIRVNNIAEIGNALDRLTPELYESRLESVKDNLEIAKKFRCAEDWIFEHYPFLFG